MKKSTTHFLFALCLSAVASAMAHGATFTAASCAESDVSAAIASASSSGGDTVIIPTCTNTTVGGGVNTWTSSLTITKPLTLQGQDSPGGTGGGSGQTVLIDNVSKSNCNTAAPLINWSTTTTTALRLTGITIQGNSVDAGACTEHVSIGTSSHAVRVDHMTFALVSIGVSIGGDAWGVVDHCVFGLNTAVAGNGGPKRGVMITHASWQNVGAWGDNSWAQQDTMGAPGTIANAGGGFPGAAVFVENNQFNYGAGSDSVGSVACDSGGARCVVRFNNPIPFIGTHGTDSTQRTRGVRHIEVYNNTISDNGAACKSAGGSQGSCTINLIGPLRSGTAMFFNNIITPTLPNSYNTGFSLHSFRLVDGWAPWGPSSAAGACDGEGPFDQNGASNPTITGTAGSGSSTDKLVDPTANFGNLAGDSLRNATTGWGSYITSNTSTSITTLSASNGGPHTWAAGNTYHVNVMTTCLDAPGRGKGNYISGGGNGMAPSPAGWPSNALDPVYAWNNSCSASSAGLCASTGQTDVLTAYYQNIKANRDFYDYNPSFSSAPTTGVGTGTLASRPSTCTAGVGYWATDQGNWNQSSSGGQGELFVCKATNIWSLYYIPYTYPHPLTQGGGTGTAPVAPANLLATPH